MNIPHDQNSPKLQQFDPSTQFTAWMGTFVRNVALNVARKRARRLRQLEARLDSRLGTKEG